jgi:hypothetical protein
MGNAQKPTTCTCHVDIKYFALCDWVERDLILLERIDMSINIADHLTKILSRILFHWHTNYLLGHVPPKYSPVYWQTISTYSDNFQDVVQYVPVTYTTPTTARQPLTAAAARIFIPLNNKIKGYPWLIVLWHEWYNLLLCYGLWGGVSIYVE